MTRGRREINPHAETHLSQKANGLCQSLMLMAVLLMEVDPIVPEPSTFSSLLALSFFDLVQLP
jgi:hypothetical protein